MDLASFPLAFVAGVLSILSPCVWPLVPVIMASTAESGRSGPWMLALGLSSAFALAGTLLSWALVSVGWDPELFRYIAAGMLLVVGLLLVVKPFGAWVVERLSALTALFPAVSTRSRSGLGLFAVGGLLGLVWLPCVGPTLGAAIALASMGQQLAQAFVVMFMFGLGTAMTLLLAAYASSSVLTRMRPGMLAGAQRAKFVLGLLLITLALLVLTGADKLLERWALGWLPEWAFSL